MYRPLARTPHLAQAGAAAVLHGDHRHLGHRLVHLGPLLSSTAAELAGFCAGLQLIDQAQSQSPAITFATVVSDSQVGFQSIAHMQGALTPQSWLLCCQEWLALRAAGITVDYL